MRLADVVGDQGGCLQERLQVANDSQWNQSQLIQLMFWMEIPHLLDPLQKGLHPAPTRVKPE